MGVDSDEDWIDAGNGFEYQFFTNFGDPIVVVCGDKRFEHYIDDWEYGRATAEQHVEMLASNGIDAHIVQPPFAGIRERHRRPDGEWCAGEWGSGGCMFDTPYNREHFASSPMWTVISLDPLELSPSILCTICGFHGFLRAGRWEPC